MDSIIIEEMVRREIEKDVLTGEIYSLEDEELEQVIWIMIESGSDYIAYA
jgi:hypothetical protein